MYDFSIEEAKSRIVDNRTKKHFEEVHSSYTHGNFRSATVMLWSVVICDIIYKLQDVRDIWADEKAKDILDIISKAQADKPNNPEWERKLVTEVASRTKLISASDKVNIDHLQHHRHLCAHPVLDGSAELLFSPSREVVRSHLRSMLDGILTKPSIMTKEIFKTFIKDIASQKDNFPPSEKESFRKFLEARYFKNMNSDVECYIFKTLWKFVFNLEGDEALANSLVNFTALDIMLDRNKSFLLKEIQDNRIYFSKYSDEVKIYHFAALIQKHQQVFDCLSEDLKELIRRRADVSLYVRSVVIMSEDVKKHFERIISFVESKHRLNCGIGLDSSISNYGWNFLLDLAKEENCLQELVKIAIMLYAKSEDYNSADMAFSKYIPSTLDYFKAEDFIFMFESIRDNHQTYDRRKAYDDHKLIMSKAKHVLPQDYDYEQFSFLPSLATSEDDVKEVIDFDLVFE